MTLHVGNCLDILPTLPAASVQCCVTSPPYWGLRDYGAEGQFGMESTPEEYVSRMVAVFTEVRRVLRDDGVLWLNLGDTYAGGGFGEQGKGGQMIDRSVAKQRCRELRKPLRCAEGLKPKDLVGIPWRVAFALQADGWYLRSEVIWHKPNPMPESVTDRPTKAHEQVFLLTKSARYFYDAEAVKEPGSGAREWLEKTRGDGKDWRSNGGAGSSAAKGPSGFGTPSTCNLRSVWTIATRPYVGAHFATFPPKLAERCIKAGTSERGCCPDCGAPWERIVERTAMMVRPGPQRSETDRQGLRTQTSGTMTKPPTSSTVGWKPSCTCPSAPPVPCMVLDPFMGAGTVAAAATSLNRRWVGIELNPEYARLALERVAGPLFAEHLS